MSKVALHNHVRLECGKEPRYFCPLYGCGYKSKLKGNLKQHLEWKHKMAVDKKGERTYKGNYSFLSAQA